MSVFPPNAFAVLFVRTTPSLTGTCTVCMPGVSARWGNLPLRYVSLTLNAGERSGAVPKPKAATLFGRAPTIPTFTVSRPVCGQSGTGENA